jgi:hypothetical protein
MLKTKLVTAYWMDVQGYPYQGAASIRKERYLGSLISHCVGSKLPVICYTHKISYDEVDKVKKDYNLDNLEIKILELNEIKLHKKINDVRTKKFDESLDGRGPEIMWGKFDVLERELEDCEQVYWVDVGLQYPGTFPWMYSKVYDKDAKNFGIPQNWWAVFDCFNFSKYIDSYFYEKLSLICKNKIMFICSYGTQISYPFTSLGILNKNFESPYPVGGMIGGDVKILKKYLNLFWEYAEKILDKEVLCTEEVIMKPTYDMLSSDEKNTFIFDVFSNNIDHDEYHFEYWKKDKHPLKPLYVIWDEIKNK